MATMATMQGAAVRAIAAASDGGGRGACLFVLDENGSLSFTAQEEPGGYWRMWEGPSFGGQPAAGSALACAGQNVDGRLILAMLDEGGKAWALSQDKEGGGWRGWDGPGLGSQSAPWKAIAAGQLSGPRGVALMAADAQGQVWICYQMNPGADWSGWSSGLAARSGGQGFAADSLAMASQGNGQLILFALSGGKVAALPQTPDQLWGAWSPLGLAGQPSEFTALAACTESKGGARLFALDPAGKVWSLAQAGPGGAWGAWTGPLFDDQPEPFASLAAAGQNDGRLALVGAGAGGSLWTVGEDGSGGWHIWRQLPAPPPT
jgi:hypothetical protein